MGVVKQSDSVTFRREIVGRLRLRGMTTREIARDLETSAEYRAGGGVPVSQQTIVKDLQALRREWKAAAAASIEEHQQAQLAEIREARRAAWKNNDLVMVEKLLAREIDLLATKNPARAPVDEEGKSVPLIGYLNDWRGRDDPE